MILTAIQRQRIALHSATNCRFVDPEEFRDLLVSRRKLIRADEPDANMHGLMDPSSEVRFLVEAERLFPPGTIAALG